MTHQKEQFFLSEGCDDLDRFPGEGDQRIMWPI